MHAFRSILVDVDATAAAHPAFSEACERRGSVLAVKPPGFVTPITLPEHVERSVGV